MSEVKMFSGEIEVIGPSKDMAEGSEYTYLRIKLADGTQQVVRRVGVGHLVESYMRPGLVGDFYTLELGKVGRILFAVKTADGQKIYEKDGFVVWDRIMKRYALLLLLGFIPLSAIALIMGGFFGFAVPIGLIYYIWKFRFSLPRLLSEEYLSGQLAARGF